MPDRARERTERVEDGALVALGQAGHLFPSRSTRGPGRRGGRKPTASRASTPATLTSQLCWRRCAGSTKTLSAQVVAESG